MQFTPKFYPTIISNETILKTVGILLTYTSDIPYTQWNIEIKRLYKTFDLDTFIPIEVAYKNMSKHTSMFNVYAMNRNLFEEAIFSLTSKERESFKAECLKNWRTVYIPYYYAFLDTLLNRNKLGPLTLEYNVKDNYIRTWGNFDFDEFYHYLINIEKKEFSEEQKRIEKDYVEGFI